MKNVYMIYRHMDTKNVRPGWDGNDSSAAEPDIGCDKQMFWRRKDIRRGSDF